jgi:hypothetical protein
MLHLSRQFSDHHVYLRHIRLHTQGNYLFSYRPFLLNVNSIYYNYLYRHNQSVNPLYCTVYKCLST